VCISRLFTCYFINIIHNISTLFGTISTLFGTSWTCRTLDSSSVRAPNELRYIGLQVFIKISSNNMSVQESCEKHDHENRQWSSMKFLCKHEKYENLIFIKTILTPRYLYVLSKTKGIHTYPKNKWVHKGNCMKNKWLKGIYVYLKF